MLSGGDGEHLDPGFVPGRKILFGGSAILFCLGIGEIAASVSQFEIVADITLVDGI